MKNLRSDDIARTAVEINRKYPLFLLSDKPSADWLRQLVKIHAAAVAIGASPDAQAVLWALISHANESGEGAYPSRETIKEIGNLSSMSSVERALAWLSARGFVTTRRRKKTSAERSVVLPQSVMDEVLRLFGIEPRTEMEFLDAPPVTDQGAASFRNITLDASPVTDQGSRPVTTGVESVVVVLPPERDASACVHEEDETTAEVVELFPNPASVPLPDSISDGLVEKVRLGIVHWPQDGPSHRVRPIIARLLISDTLRLRKVPDELAERVISDSADALRARPAKANHSRLAWQKYFMDTAENILTNIRAKAAAEMIRAAKEQAELAQIEKQAAIDGQIQDKRLSVFDKATASRGAAEAPGRQKAKPPVVLDVDRPHYVWQRRMELWEARGREIWPEAWGPKPGAAGCFVPADLIAEFTVGVAS
jgi:hypothetical protein